jgi:hypothetical protein
MHPQWAKLQVDVDAKLATMDLQRMAISKLERCMHAEGHRLWRGRDLRRFREVVLELGFVIYPAPSARRVANYVARPPCDFGEFVDDGFALVNEHGWTMQTGLCRTRPYFSPMRPTTQVWARINSVYDCARAHGFGEGITIARTEFLRGIVPAVVS